MAALNYNILLSDGGDNGSGPYTVTVLKNPTTAASGGTSVTPDFGATNTAQTFSPYEIGTAALHAIGDSIAAANTSDTLNSTA